MVNIYLHGLLGKFFDKVFSINVRSAEEAIRALDANTSDLFSKKMNSLLLNGHSYSIVVDGKIINDFNLFKRKSNNIKEIHFLPEIKGSGPVFTVIMIILQVAYVVWQFSQKPKAQPAQNIAVGGEVSSVNAFGRNYIFSNNVNVTAQGVSIPIGYGKMMSNSIVLQSNLKSYSTSDTFNLQVSLSPNFSLFEDFLTS